MQHVSLAPQCVKACTLSPEIASLLIPIYRACILRNKREGGSLVFNELGCYSLSCGRRRLTDEERWRRGKIFVLLLPLLSLFLFDSVPSCVCVWKRVDTPGNLGSALSPLSLYLSFFSLPIFIVLTSSLIFPLERERKRK